MSENPVVEVAVEAVPEVANQAIRVLYASGDIIVIDAKDLKSFAIKGAVVLVYGGVMYWSYKKHWKPWRDDRREHKAWKKKMAEREATRANSHH